VVSSHTTSGTTLDEFLGGRIAVLQPERGHRSGSDAVFLAAAVGAMSGMRALEAGAGAGVASLCLLARVPGIHINTVEINPALCALAEANADRNGFGASFRAIAADVTAKGDALAALGFAREAYDEVFANPPFYDEGTIRAAPDAGREAAHVMEKGGLEAWLRFFATMAAPKGHLTLIHRPDVLPSLLPLLAARFGGICVFPLFARAESPASRVILRARKGSKEGLKLLPGLVLHEPDGRYTDAAEAILRHGAPIGIA
jgi:tRNA1(Val) A37 N6-methylase TrmN6